MTIVSSELRQVFKAYTRQLRGQYAKTSNVQHRETRAPGFERVQISDEARALAAAGLPDLESEENVSDKDHEVDDPKSNEDPDNP